MSQEKKALILKYFTILAVIVGSFCIVSAAGIFAYMIVSPGSKEAQPSVDIKTGATLQPTYTSNPIKTEAPDNSSSSITDIFKAPDKTNFVIIGVDKSGLLADVVIAGCFNASTKKINLISIPRDTYVKIPSERLQSLKDLGRKNLPSNGVMKINEVHSYAGKDLGTEYVLNQVEDILCVKMDYYIEVSLSAFRKIVDDIGGVRMQIPAGGLYYEDPAQDLLINIPGGSVNLDGELAEGLVRYRSGYARADLQRVEVQQQFMKELFKQALSRDRIIKNAPALISTFVSYVKTNFKITDLPKYLWYLDEVISCEIEATTLPGTAEKSQYFEHYVEETAKLVEGMFY